jgi:hypothetical protein
MKMGAGTALFLIAAATGLRLQGAELAAAWLFAAKSGVLLLFLAGTAACGLLRPADLARLGRRMAGRAAA